MKLIFDVDGTILESMHIWIEPMNDIFEKYGFKMDDLENEMKGKIEALSFEATCQFIADEIAKDMSYEEVRAYFLDNLIDAYNNTLMPKKGAVEILTKLKDRGFDMAIASSTNFPYLEASLKRIGIFDYFDFFVTPDLIDEKKSDRDYRQYAIDKFNVEPSHIMLFDDALYAIKAANKIGIQTTAVKDFPWNEKEWPDIVKNAKNTLDSIADIDIESLK